MKKTKPKPLIGNETFNLSVSFIRFHGFGRKLQGHKLKASGKNSSKKNPHTTLKMLCTFTTHRFSVLIFKKIKNDCQKCVREFWILFLVKVQGERKCRALGVSEKIFFLCEIKFLISQSAVLVWLECTQWAMMTKWSEKNMKNRFRTLLNVDCLWTCFSVHLSLSKLL